MSYVDGFVIAVPTANREKFRKHAEMAAAIFIENGALSLAGCLGDDVPYGKGTPVPEARKQKEEENVGGARQPRRARGARFPWG